MNWEQIKTNLKHLPSTIIGVGLLLSTLPQLAEVQKIMAISPRVANIISTTATIAGGIASIVLLGQKIFTKK